MDGRGSPVLFSPVLFFDQFCPLVLTSLSSILKTRLPLEQLQPAGKRVFSEQTWGWLNGVGCQARDHQAVRQRSVVKIGTQAVGGLSGIVSCDAAAIRIRIRIVRCQRPAKRQKHIPCETQARLFSPASPCW